MCLSDGLKGYQIADLNKYSHSLDAVIYSKNIIY